MANERPLSLLIVDDDQQILRMLSTQLIVRGYSVRVADNGPDALTAVSTESFDLIVLDIMMPDMDGLEVCRKLREWSSVPIILLTAADTPQTKITGLDLGADDYLTKPFNMGELLARMRAVLRRTSTDDKTTQSVIVAGDLTIDLTAREVRRNGEILHLTKTEFDLLSELATHAGKVLTYDHILRAVWDFAYEDNHLVQVHVGNLRRKIEKGPLAPRYIIALPGVGYRFRLPE